jgi:hypothetical protein
MKNRFFNSLGELHRFTLQIRCLPVSSPLRLSHQRTLLFTRPASLISRQIAPTPIPSPPSLCSLPALAAARPDLPFMAGFIPKTLLLSIHKPQKQLSCPLCRVPGFFTRSKTAVLPDPLHTFQLLIALSPPLMSYPTRQKARN